MFVEAAEQGSRSPNRMLQAQGRRAKNIGSKTSKRTEPPKAKSKHNITSTTEPPKIAAQLDNLHISPEQAVLEQQHALARAESRAQQNFLATPDDDAKSLGAQSRNASRDPSRENIGRRLNASKNSKQSQLQQRERELKNIAEDISEEARKLAKKISAEHFQQMCGDKDTTKKTPTITTTSLRLAKPKFQQFLKGRFGIPFAEKIHNILDYTRAVDFNSYQAQVEMIIKDRNFMLQLAFDVFDANDDKKISQLDLFKTFKQFQKGAMANRFGEIFYHDVCQMSKKIS